MVNWHLVKTYGSRGKSLGALQIRREPGPGEATHPEEIIRASLTNKKYGGAYPIRRGGIFQKMRKDAGDHGAMLHHLV